MTKLSDPFLSNFAWAVPTAFSDAVGACQFSRGDTLYSSPIAYREWNEEFYNLAKGLHAIKVLSPEAKPAPPSPCLFQSLSSNSKCNTTGPDGLRCCHVNKILSTHEC